MVGNLATSSPITVGSARAGETDKEDWQNGKTYESYGRSYIKLEKS